MSKSLPKVAIVGQTNVGKSSLFNRLIGTQQAIVAREPGTTRDNVVGKVTSGKYTFWLVDTAGLKDPIDDFEASIQEQIEDAVDVADVIMVVVDSTKYPSDDDKLVAKKALKSKKPVILVVNKTDLKNSLPSDEFLRLGVKEKIRTSAEHNGGIDSLLKSITKLIPPQSDEASDNVLRLALIGRPNVGKSHLFNTLAGKQQAIVAPIAGTTRDVNRLSVRYENRDIELLDTAGVRRAGKIGVGIEKFSVLRTLAAIDEADVCFLLIDANEIAVSLDQKLAGMIKEAGKGLVLVVSKWDSAEKDAFTRDAMAKDITYEFAFAPWAPLIFTSAVTGQNVTQLFKIATEIDSRRKLLLKTGELNRLLQKTTDRHPPSGLRNAHPKIRYMVQTDVQPPWFVMFGSDLRYLHWSYKRHLERVIREEHDFIGTPINFSWRDEKVERKKREREAEHESSESK